MKNTILNKFEKLSQTVPNTDWSLSCKQRLLAQAELITPKKSSNWFSLTTWKTERFALRLVSSAPKALSAIIGLFIIAGTTGIVAEASYVPKQTLYTVKQTMEKFELLLATSPEKESEVYAKHLQRRVEEAEKIVSSTSLTDTEKEQHLKTIIKSIEKNAANVSAGLSQVQNETNVNNDSVTNLALTITQSTKQASKALNSLFNNGSKADDGLNQNSAAVAAGKAITATDLAETDALMVLAKNVDGKKPNKPIETIQLINDSKEIDITPGSVINEIVMTDLVGGRLYSLEKRINELARRVKFEPSEMMKKVLSENQLEAEKLNNFFKRSQLISGYIRQAVVDGKFSVAIEMYNSLNKETGDMLETINRMLVNGQIELKESSASDKK